MAFDHAGKLWLAFNELNAVKESDPPSLQVELPTNSKPTRIAVGPEGDLWVTMFGAGAIDRITTTGERTRFALSPGSSRRASPGAPARERHQ